MKEKLIGSHNSWTFGKTKWYVPAFVARCQTLNIKQQYAYGVRLFDLRLRLDGKVWKVSHGPIYFNSDFIEDIQWLNYIAMTRKDIIYVRVVLEYNSVPKNYDTISKQFCDICANLKKSNPYIRFFSGRLKCTWNRIYDFGIEEPVLNDQYSSTTTPIPSTNRWGTIAKIDDWWPWLYARMYNKDNYKKFFKDHSDNEWLFIDFVEYI